VACRIKHKHRNQREQKIWFLQNRSETCKGLKKNHFTIEKSQINPQKNAKADNILSRKDLGTAPKCNKISEQWLKKGFILPHSPRIVLFPTIPPTIHSKKKSSIKNMAPTLSPPLPP